MTTQSHADNRKRVFLLFSRSPSMLLPTVVAAWLGGCGGSELVLESDGGGGGASVSAARRASTSSGPDAGKAPLPVATLSESLLTTGRHFDSVASCTVLLRGDLEKLVASKLFAAADATAAAAGRRVAAQANSKHLLGFTGEIREATAPATDCLIACDAIRQAPLDGKRLEGTRCDVVAARPLAPVAVSGVAVQAVYDSDPAADVSGLQCCPASVTDGIWCTQPTPPPEPCVGDCPLPAARFYQLGDPAKRCGASSCTLEMAAVSAIVSCSECRSDPITCCQGPDCPGSPAPECPPDHYWLECGESHRTLPGFASAECVEPRQVAPRCLISLCVDMSCPECTGEVAGGTLGHDGHADPEEPHPGSGASPCPYATPNPEGGVCDGVSRLAHAQAIELYATALGCSAAAGDPRCCGESCVCFGSRCTRCDSSIVGRPGSPTTGAGATWNSQATCTSFARSPGASSLISEEADADEPDAEKPDGEQCVGRCELEPEVVEGHADAPGPTPAAETSPPPQNGDPQPPQGGQPLPAAGESGHSGGLPQPPPTEPNRRPEPDSKPRELGDPVSVGDGSLDLSETDLSFDGSESPLRLTRHYRSRSAHRGGLGSNWTHNFEVWIEAVQPGTAPGWAPDYCRQWAPQVTCVFLHDGERGGALFQLDSDRQLFLPAAGSTDTLAASKDGWVLRSAQGAYRVFDRHGYLILEQDPLGNRVTVELQPTPLYTLYYRYCKRPELREARGYDVRACLWLGWMFGDLPDEVIHGIDWSELAPVEGCAGAESCSTGQACRCVSRPLTWPDDPSPRLAAGEPDPRVDYAAWLAAAKTMAAGLVVRGPAPLAPTGLLRQRVYRVQDELGRAITFAYANPAQTLSSVHGPAGARVLYTYATPGGNYPARLGEYFLTATARSDRSTSPELASSRSQSLLYVYQWPSQGVPSYQLYENEVLERYRRYFASFLGCTVERVVGCDLPLPIASRPTAGNPCLAATIAHDDYLQAVADNIVRIERQDGATLTRVVELETAFEPNPLGTSSVGDMGGGQLYVGEADKFDRVIAQRYGGSELADAGPADAWPWRTRLPRHRFDYCLAQPLGQPGGGTVVGDVTDYCLPDPIRERYPLEAHATGLPPLASGSQCDESERIACAAPENALGGVIRPGSCNRASAGFTIAECRIDLLAATRAEMGARRQLAYYDHVPPAGESHDHPRLRRTSLSCEQLAAEQFREPAHNELLSRVAVYAWRDCAEIDREHALLIGLSLDQARARCQQAAGEPIGWSYQRITRDDSARGRPWVAANLRRICAWTRSVDRDGVTTWTGLNYHGQSLVAATYDSVRGQYVFEEKLYNADGFLSEHRLPSAGMQPWDAATGGLVEYVYDEPDPRQADGSGGWAPSFWTRRGNLVEVRRWPRGGPLGYRREDGSQGTTPFECTRITYEPLFNRPQMIDRGVAELQNTGSSFNGQPIQAYLCARQHRTLVELDYQERAFDELRQTLGHLARWGFGVTDPTAGLDLVRGLLPPLGLGDLNGDGQLGFGHQDRPNVLGLPVRVTEQPGAAARTTRLRWTRHGQLKWIERPGGLITVLEYYAASGRPEEVYGREGLQPLAQVGQQSPALGAENGLLRAIVSARLPAPGQSGPAAPACAALAGPYQWLLPASCSDPGSELAALGLSAELVASIGESTDPSSGVARDQVVFAYDLTGKARYVAANGDVTRLRHDLDGKVVASVDPLGLRTAIQHDVQGNPIIEARSADNPARPGAVLSLGKTVRRYDRDRQLLAECVELERDRCTDGLVAAASYGQLSPPGTLLATFRYSDGGRRTGASDGAGRAEETLHSSLGLPIESRSRDLLSNRVRVTRRRFDLDGHVERIDHGDGAGGLSEILSWDGAGRLASHSDQRGITTRFRHASTGELASVRQQTANGAVKESIYGYDPHGRLVLANHSGLKLLRFYRDLAGNAYRVDESGPGQVPLQTTFASYDADGQPLWEQDPEGNVRVVARDLLAHTEDSATIRRRPDGTVLATSHSRLTDARGDLLQETAIGHHGERQVTELHRDALGFVVDTRRPGHSTSHRRNLLGWVLSSSVKVVAGVPSATWETSDRAYNGRGQVTSIRDPSKLAHNTTYFTYNGFGEITELTPPETEGRRSFNFTYDQHGRLQSKLMPDGAGLFYDYDGAYLTQVRRAAANGAQVVSQYTYDGFGRQRSSIEHNRGLEALGVVRAGEGGVWLAESHDDLDRVVATSLSGGGVVKNFSSAWQGTPTGWRRNLVYPSGQARQQTFDRIGRLAVLRTRTSAGAWLRTDFQWLGDLAAGRRQEWTSQPLASPVVTAVKHDGLGRQLSWETSDGNVLYQAETYRDVAGRIVSHSSELARAGAAPPAARSWSWRGYAYDLAGRLSTVWESDRGDGSQPALPGLVNHTDGNDLEAAARSAAATRWDYSRGLVGDLASITDHDSGEARWQHIGDRHVGHRLARVSLDGLEGEVIHDASGRVTGALAQGLGFIYDERDRLVAVTEDGRWKEAYGYDARGRLTTIYRPAGNAAALASFIVNDGQQMIASYGGDGGLQWEATWGGTLDELVEWSTPQARYLPLTDHRGSIIGVREDQSRTVSAVAGYDAEGRLKCEAAAGAAPANQPCTPPAGTPFGFLGAYRSAQSGLVYLRNRWYSPALGQFLSPDPLGHGDGFNRYAYAAMDPINRVDPLGLQSAWQRKRPDDTSEEETPAGLSPGELVEHYGRRKRDGVGANEAQRAFFRREWDDVTHTLEPYAPIPSAKFAKTVSSGVEAALGVLRVGARTDISDELTIRPGSVSLAHDKVRTVAYAKLRAPGFMEAGYELSDGELAVMAGYNFRGEKEMLVLKTDSEGIPKSVGVKLAVEIEFPNPFPGVLGKYLGGKVKIAGSGSLDISVPAVVQDAIRDAYDRHNHLTRSNAPHWEFAPSIQTERAAARRAVDAYERAQGRPQGGIGRW